MLQVHVGAIPWRFKSSPGHNEMKKVIIKTEDSGARLDKFLKDGIFFDSELTRGEIIRNIKEGNVRVNGKIAKPSYRLREDDELEINLAEKKTQLAANEKVRLEIIFQDQDLIAVNKPAGLSVHPSNLEDESTLVNGLLAKFPEIGRIGDGSLGSELRPGIVHRLDKETSGVMVVARTQAAFDELKKIFAEREVKKKYLALVLGKLESKSGVIEKPLARAASRKKQVVAHKRTKTKTRPAITEYQVLREWENYSLVEARPKTGRMHQIRVHFYALGHPVAGDKKYSLKKFEKIFQPERQLLQAESLEFELHGRRYCLKTTLPADFAGFLASLDEKRINR